MVDLDELWIGDLLLLKKSKRIGKFDGRIGHKKVRIRIGDKTVITTLSNLEHAPEDFTEKQIQNLSNPKSPLQKSRSISNVIDLHIEVLNSSMINTRPERIIDYQIKTAKDFIDSAIMNKIPKIEIIHGKGAGVLKSEIDHLIYLYSDKIKAQFPLNQGGSVEIWFNNL